MMRFNLASAVAAISIDEVSVVALLWRGVGRVKAGRKNEAIATRVAKGKVVDVIVYCV